jgi:putative transposase
VWSYDFVGTHTHNGRSVRLLNLIDEHTRECLLIRAERRWTSAKVIEALADVMVCKGVPEHIRSDNGPEFVAKDLRQWFSNAAPGHYTSNPALRGRTAIASCSTASAEMSF